jgi:hypothetical protein
MFLAPRRATPFISLASDAAFCGVLEVVRNSARI